MSDDALGIDDILAAITPTSDIAAHLSELYARSQDWTPRLFHCALAAVTIRRQEVVAEHLHGCACAKVTKWRDRSPYDAGTRPSRAW